MIRDVVGGEGWTGAVRVKPNHDMKPHASLVPRQYQAHSVGASGFAYLVLCVLCWPIA